MDNKNETKLGVFYALFAFTFWGLIPIYFKALEHVSAFEILMHRVIWSVVFLLLIIWKKREFSHTLLVIKNKKIATYLLFSSIIIAINWLTFIWAVEQKKIIETSLGYYINPLVTIFFAYIFLKESPTKMQKIAIFLAFLAVAYQIFSLGYFPLISMILAVSFALYGLIRKKAHVSSLVGLFIETIFLFPLALGYLFYINLKNQSHFSFTNEPYTSLLLLLAGVITVLPLLAFNSATIRLRLSTIGFFQYIGPSVSFLLAIFIYNEPLSYEKLITFSLIWLALLLISLETIKRR